MVVLNKKELYRKNMTSRRNKVILRKIGTMMIKEGNVHLALKLLLFLVFWYSADLGIRHVDIKT